MLDIKPISLKEANAYVEINHRHHRKATGHKFSLGVYEDDVLHGVVIVGRPLSRYLDDGMTLEVLRLCTDGTKNACSILYSRSARIAREMGYNRIITYILMEESGNSLIASGWQCEEVNVGGGSWENCTRREGEYKQISLFPESDKYPIGKKQRWVKQLREVKNGCERH